MSVQTFHGTIGEWNGGSPFPSSGIFNFRFKDTLESAWLLLLSKALSTPLKCSLKNGPLKRTIWEPKYSRSMAYFSLSNWGFWGGKDGLPDRSLTGLKRNFPLLCPISSPSPGVVWNFERHTPFNWSKLLLFHLEWGRKRPRTSRRGSCVWFERGRKNWRVLLHPYLQWADFEAPFFSFQLKWETWTCYFFSFQSNAY